MLQPVQSVVQDAVDAAIRVASDTRAMRAMAAIPLDGLTSYVDRLQRGFEQVRPVAGLPTEDVQTAAAALYGARAPADVAALFAAGQMAGGGVVLAADGVYLAAPARDRVMDWNVGRYAPRNVAGDDLTPLHAAMDALLAALAPVAGDG